MVKFSDQSNLLLPLPAPKRSFLCAVRESTFCIIQFHVSIADDAGAALVGCIRIKDRNDFGTASIGGAQFQFLRLSGSNFGMCLAITSEMWNFHSFENWQNICISRQDCRLPATILHCSWFKAHQNWILQNNHISRTHEIANIKFRFKRGQTAWKVFIETIGVCSMLLVSIHDSFWEFSPPNRMQIKSPTQKWLPFFLGKAF